MDLIALRRLHVLPLDPGPAIRARDRMVVLSDLLALGYRVTNPEALTAATEEWLVQHNARLAELSSIRGGDVDYVPLFLGFPSDVPDDDTYFAKRIVAAVGNHLQWFPDGTTLENGLVIPDWLFDLKQFGADPVTQFQTPALWTDAVGKLSIRAEDAHTEWIDLTLVTRPELNERLTAWLNGLLQAKSSIKEALHDDLIAVLGHLGFASVDAAEVGNKENRALLLKTAWEAGDAEAVASIADTPTDLLRMFAALTGSDVSLAEPIKFSKMRRPQRRLVLRVLAGCSNLAEDLNRYRGLWLACARYIHPGEHRKLYPAVADTFRALAQGRLPTFASRTEALIEAREIAPLLDHLIDRPGVLARKVHELLSKFAAEADEVLDHLAMVASSVRSRRCWCCGRTSPRSTRRTAAPSSTCGGRSGCSRTPARDTSRPRRWPGSTRSWATRSRR
ncbi:MAG: hypothetical protein GY898_26865 [Proteobacteria bacterium]|nr:hypothetical protein [Pseudomonadota bacterium]